MPLRNAKVRYFTTETPSFYGIEDLYILPDQSLVSYIMQAGQFDFSLDRKRSRTHYRNCPGIFEYYHIVIIR